MFVGEIWHIKSLLIWQMPSLLLKLAYLALCNALDSHNPNWGVLKINSQHAAWFLEHKNIITWTPLTNSQHYYKAPAMFCQWLVYEVLIYFLSARKFLSIYWSFFGERSNQWHLIPTYSYWTLVLEQKGWPRPYKVMAKLFQSPVPQGQICLCLLTKTKWKLPYLLSWLFRTLQSQKSVSTEYSHHQDVSVILCYRKFGRVWVMRWSSECQAKCCYNISRREAGSIIVTFFTMILSDVWWMVA